MEKPMRILFSIFLFCLLGVTMTVADSGNGGKRSGKAPDSILTCEGMEGTYRPINGTVPAAFSLDECAVSTCSVCIRSLETQGCRVVETVVAPGDSGSEAGPGCPVGGTVGRSEPRVTFLLSCERP